MTVTYHNRHYNCTLHFSNRILNIMSLNLTGTIGLDFRRKLSLEMLARSEFPVSIVFNKYILIK